MEWREEDTAGPFHVQILQEDQSGIECLLHLFSNLPIIGIHESAFPS